MTRTVIAAIVMLMPACSSVDWSSARWAPLDTGTDASLRGLCVLEGGVVWASGSGGTVLRSTDAGTTWTTHRVPGDEQTDLRDIEAVDADTAWVIAITKPARILVTRDGGASWTEVHRGSDPRSFFDSIALFEGGGGVVFGDPRDGVFEILRSADGVTWTHARAEDIPQALEGEAAFAASGTCVVSHGRRHAWIGTGGRHSRVLRSSDGGKTWKATRAPMPAGGQTTGIYGVQFTNRDRGVVLGGDYTKPEIGGNNAAWTADGGITWSPGHPATSGYRSCCASLPRTRAGLIAVGRAGADLSTDGGRSWAPFAVETGYYAVDSAPDGTVIAVGSEGRAARLQPRAPKPF